MSDQHAFIIETNGSFAQWQMTARDTGDVQTWETATKLADGRYHVALDRADSAGYFFQYNGHTAFLLNFDGDHLNYRTQPDVSGLVLTDPAEKDGPAVISFDVRPVVLRIRKNAYEVRKKPKGGKPEEVYKIHHGMDRDILESYRLADIPGKTVRRYRLMMLKGARFMISSSATLTEGEVRSGNAHFKLRPDGSLTRYVSVRAASIEGIARDVEIPDAYFVARTVRRKPPVIEANPGYWQIEKDRGAGSRVKG